MTFDTTSGVMMGRFAPFFRSLSPVSAPAAASRMVSVLRASPPAMRMISSTASSVILISLSRPCLLAMARLISVFRSSGSSDSSLTTTDRLSSGLMTEKLGFSVVAAMKVTSRFSTLGSNASCCDLEKRCTSSMNNTVSLPSETRRSCARLSTSRTSLTPEVTADSSSKTRPDCLATI